MEQLGQLPLGLPVRPPGPRGVQDAHEHGVSHLLQPRRGQLSLDGILAGQVELMLQKAQIKIKICHCSSSWLNAFRWLTR